MQIRESNRIKVSKASTVDEAIKKMFQLLRDAKQLCEMLETQCKQDQEKVLKAGVEELAKQIGDNNE